MKCFVIIAALFAVGFSGPALEKQYIAYDSGDMEYFLVETSPGVYEVEDLVNGEVDLRASESDITYHFFSQKDSNGVDITASTIDSLKKTKFSRSRDTLFIIHGWKNSNESEVNYHIRESILATNNINVFVVDWSPIAGKTYLSAQGSVVTVGQYIANFIKLLVSQYRVKLSNVALVGHSLGAHIAGNVGAALNGEVDHIVGLDPAGPLFSSKKIDNRLDPTDAKFVQVIHTNDAILGFNTPCGHADYYPNGGSSQPGCGIDIAGTCAHGRAYVYYAEAISSASNGFVSTQCTTYRDYQRNRCTNNDKSVMGGYSVDTRASGAYYLYTNKQSPFAQG